MESDHSHGTSGADLQLVYFDGCPHWRVALARLEAALAQLGRSDTVELRVVTPDAEAQRHHMAGSPTILIDGRDPYPNAGPTWCCRLYPNETGPEGAPSVASLVEFLS